VGCRFGPLSPGDSFATTVTFRVKLPEGEFVDRMSVKWRAQGSWDRKFTNNEGRDSICLFRGYTVRDCPAP
jgi:hypothetical protein